MPSASGFLCLQDPPSTIPRIHYIMVKRAADTAESIEVKSLDELHAWLAANHASSPSVWLVTFRKHTAFHLPYDDIVSELLCWGWIDSQPRKVDDDRTGLLIAPRNPRSAWSAANKARVDDLRAAGRLQPAGEALVTAAQNPACGRSSTMSNVSNAPTT